VTSNILNIHFEEGRRRMHFLEDDKNTDSWLSELDVEWVWVLHAVEAHGCQSIIMGSFCCSTSHKCVPAHDTFDEMPDRLDVVYKVHKSGFTVAQLLHAHFFKPGNYKMSNRDY
jgi:hypothetical protein